MSVHYRDDAVTVHHGDCLDVLRELPDASVDAVVTDPPYGLEFMGKEWDRFAVGRSARYAKGGDLNLDDIAAQSGKGGAGPSYTSRPAKRCRKCGKQAWSGSPCVCEQPEWEIDNSPLLAFGAWCEQWATECLRVLKPGGHLLAFGGTRTWHRLACAIEDAGFEVRDSIAWLYGSGFPKSLDVSKAIDKAAGVTGTYGEPKSAAHADMLARGVARRGEKHEGWDRPWMDDPEAVRNAQRKYEPGSDDARRWQGWGTALKPAFEPIVVARKPLVGTVAANVLTHGTGALNVDACRVGTVGGTARSGESGRLSPSGAFTTGHDIAQIDAGRWPANVLLDPDSAAELDKQSGTLTSGHMKPTHTTASREVFGQNAAGGYTTMETYGDSGGASRFFPTFRYEAKAPTAERPRDGAVAHPTVKPLDLMRWLVRLVTPPGGVVLEPFAGSGTTAEACVIEGFRCIAIEREATYLPLIVARLTKPIQPDLFGGAA